MVGHTDATGALAANQAVSTARAAAVRQRLINENGVNPAQLDAAGAGYLAPRASNADADGRALNRRVEVVVLPAAG
ncbi:OmpA family protein [Ketogulonicigenium robustum]|uniref:OmpA family protein n=1 Tax=Ketogulonicigenium robustum TaxID=92947 RepID=UPI001F27C686|nr:OmpA family protein [Ketogulonicigenium robustum]